MNMKNTKLYIVPLAIDVVNGKYYTLVINDPDKPDGISLPFVYNNPEIDVDLQIKESILNYINVNPDWLKIGLFPKLRNKDNVLEVFYYFSIPYENIKIIDQNKAAIINFDLVSINDPFLSNLKYFI